MPIFVDASALIAMVAGEPDATDLSDRLDRASTRLCSTVSVWEAVAGLAHSYRLATTDARERIESFVKEMKLCFVPMGEREYELAIDAYERFGKGHHPAALNMGDCHAYATGRAPPVTRGKRGRDLGFRPRPQAFPPHTPPPRASPQP